MVCRDFILPEGFKPCLLLSSFQFCETYSTLSREIQPPFPRLSACGPSEVGAGFRPQTQRLLCAASQTLCLAQAGEMFSFCGLLSTKEKPHCGIWFRSQKCFPSKSGQEGVFFYAPARFYPTKDILCQGACPSNPMETDAAPQDFHAKPNKAVIPRTTMPPIMSIEATASVAPQAGASSGAVPEKAIDTLSGSVMKEFNTNRPPATESSDSRR